MCCGSTETLELPAQVIEALAGYRRALDERGWDWGDERIDFFRALAFADQGQVMATFFATGSWVEAVRSAVADAVPTGTVVVKIDETGAVDVRTGPRRSTVRGRSVRINVVVDSTADAELMVTLDGRRVAVAARGAAVETIDVSGPFTITVDGRGEAIVEAIDELPAAELRLRSSRCARWSVTDANGGAWFPDGVLPKWDVHHRPFFHGHDVRLAVPAEALEVVCTRGLEFDRTVLDASPQPGESVQLECEPTRLFDPAAAGWYGGDLHVHMNYSGDLVCTPADVARMQHGEGLHLLNLVAGNCLHSLVYDRDLLEQTVGSDLPWSNEVVVARMGVEYRNDLLGHFHALGPNATPTRFYTGHDRSDHPEDWPPNSAAAAELRDLDATVGYCHPAIDAFPDDGSTRQFFQTPRSVEARELVVDAALGLVDSMDLISPTNDEGAVFLYHRLLSTGLRLAATAGTDTFLSFSKSGTFSNPPGWGRVYAHLDGEPLTVDAFKRAIRAGRTVATNGPWLTLEVNGRGPGAAIDLASMSTVRCHAVVTGYGVDQLALIGPDGIVAETDRAGELRAEIEVDRPTWIAAVARGGPHPHTLDAAVLAHTTPVYVDMAGSRVARAADAQWCLDFLDRFETLLDEHGHFDPATRDEHLADHRAQIDTARAYYRTRLG